MCPLNNYYPFGLKHKGYNNVINGTDHPYGFQEQEEQNELGLDWIQYKYRNHDPALGRFFNIDPLTEDYMDWGPYVFSGNRVIDARELEGLEPFFVNSDMSFSQNVQNNVNAYSTMASNLSDTAQFILNPVETVKGVVGLVGALLNPVDTASAIVDNVSQTITDLGSDDPNVQGPALGDIGSFAVETGAGLGIGKVSKVSKVATVADDVTKTVDNFPNAKPGSAGGPGAGKNFSESVKNAAEAQAGGDCVFCGVKTTRGNKPHSTRRNTDHAISKKNGGNNSLLNAQNTCQSCNLKKNSLNTNQFIRKMLND